MNFVSHYGMNVSRRFKILELKVLSSITIKYFSGMYINQHKGFVNNFLSFHVTRQYKVRINDYGEFSNIL
jgi:hypothetical protein